MFTVDVKQQCNNNNNCDLRLESALLHKCTIFQCSWLDGPLVMEKVFEVFILYMDMLASFGHVTK